MILSIANAGQILNLYRETQLNTRPDEKTKFGFTVRGNTAVINNSYKPYRENLLGFLKDLGVKHKVKKY